MKLKFQILCFALQSLCTNAFGNALPQQELVPGGIAILPIAKRGDIEPLVYFNTERVTLLPDPENKNNWLAVVGIPLASSAGQYSIDIEWDDKIKSTQTFTNHAKHYPESRLIIDDKKKVEPGKEELDRIWKEQKIIDIAKASRLDNIPSLDMILPTKGSFSSAFGLKRFMNGIQKNSHGGLDIAANTGTPIIAPADGTVVATGDFFFSGNCVYIDHGMGAISFYGHMTKVDVKQGQLLKQGDQLGTVGATGRVTGPHLHWSISLNGAWVNPVLFLRSDKKNTVDASSPSK